MHENDIVRVRFLRDDGTLHGQHGQEYRYHCPGARLGDIIQASGNSRAKVIGYGRGGYNGTVRDADIIVRATQFPCFTTKAVQDALIKPNPLLALLASGTYDTYYGGTTMNPAPTPVELLAEQLAAAKKAEKRARKIARERKAVVAEKLRLRQLAIETLENVAEHSSNDAARIEAAIALLDRA